MLDIMRENASGWIVKILFAIIIIVFVFAFGMSGFNAGDPVLAKVDGEPITRAAFQATYQRAAEAYGRSNPQVTQEQLRSPEFKQMVLGELVSTQLLLAEAEKLGVGASDTEVFAAISAQPMFHNTEGKFDKNVYQASLRAIHMTPAEFEADFKRQITVDKVKRIAAAPADATPAQARQLYDWVGEQAKIDYVLVSPTDFASSVEVSNEDIHKFYEDNEERFTSPPQVQLKVIKFTPQDLATQQEVTDEEVAAYYEANKTALSEKEQVRARHILVAVKEGDSESVQAEAKQKIGMILAKAKAGEDFAALAKEYSEGPSAPNGGELGWFGRDMMVPEFEEAAFNGAKGDVVGPVKTQFGWHVIKIEDRKEGGTQPLEEVKDDVRQQIAQEKASDKLTNLLDEAMDRLVSGMSMDDIAKELDLTAEVTEPMPASFLGQIFGFDDEAAQVIDSLPEGQAYQNTVAIKGGYMLVQKIKNIPPTLLAFEKSRPTIITTLKKEKAQQAAQAEADKILAALSGPDADKAAKTYASRIATSDAFNRQGNIPGIGGNQELAKAVFAAKDDAWLDKTYSVQTGILVARLHERIPASEDTWKEQKDFWMQQATRTYQQEMLTAYMERLHDQAEIEVLQPDVLQ